MKDVEVARTLHDLVEAGDLVKEDAIQVSSPWHSWLGLSLQFLPKIWVKGAVRKAVIFIAALIVVRNRSNSRFEPTSVSR